MAYLARKYPPQKPSAAWRLDKGWRGTVQALCSIQKVSTNQAELPRTLLFNNPTLLMLKDERGKVTVTRMLHINEIEEIVQSQDGRQVCIKAKRSTRLRDWVFSWTSDRKNYPAQPQATVVQMLADFYSLYVDRPLRILTSSRPTVSSNNLKKPTDCPSIRQCAGKITPKVLPHMLDTALEREPAEPLEPQEDSPTDKQPAWAGATAEDESAPAEAAAAAAEDDNEPLLVNFRIHPDNGAFGFRPSMSPDKPVRIKDIPEGSAMWNSGLKYLPGKEPAHIIHSVDGMRIHDPEHLMEVLKERTHQNEVVFTMQRGSYDVSDTESDEEEEEEEVEDDDETTYYPPVSQRSGSQGSRVVERPFVPPPVPAAEPVATPTSPGRVVHSSRPRRGRASARRRPKDRFWKHFLQQYEQQEQHWGRIEGDVLRGVDRGVSERFHLVDFEGDALLSLDPQETTAATTTQHLPFRSESPHAAVRPSAAYAPSPPRSAAAAAHSPGWDHDRTPYHGRSPPPPPTLSQRRQRAGVSGPHFSSPNPLFTQISRSRVCSNTKQKMG